MVKTLVFGHKSPDTDTITSAIVYANLKRALGVEAEAVRLGELNKETEYVLNHFNVKAPRLVEKLDPENEQAILVDHNEFQQSVDNIRQVKIVEVIDHHRVANFETADPLYFRVEPVGCTATILLKMYKESDVEVTKTMAGLMLSAIVSDSLLFKSPTCTEEDVQAAKELSVIAGIDTEAYGFDMLKAGTDVGDKSIAELLAMDAKEFTMGKSKVEIAQINAVDLASVYEKQAEFEAEIEKTIEVKNLDLFLLAVTDIVNSNSDALALGKSADHVEKAFDVKIENNRAFLPGVVSRKKQLVTKLTETFK